MEALWTHFLPHYKFVQDKVASGTLGEIQSLKADFGFNSPFDTTSRLYNKSLGGGSLLDVGIYPVFAALSLLGYTEDIEAKATLGPTGVDHNCSMLLRYAQNVEVQLFSAIDEETPTRCHIVLEKGEIIINSRFHEPSSVTLTENGVTETLEFSTPNDVNGYHYEILHCQEMLALRKTESDVMTFSKSKELIMLLDKIRAQIGLSY